jgi:Coenzyme PQQ synthesis protein D (PqqD)
MLINEADSMVRESRIQSSLLPERNKPANQTIFNAGTPERHMESTNSSFIKGADLTTRRIAGETLIVPIRGHVGDLDAIYTLNELGSRIWQLLDKPATVKQIAAIISAEYEVTQAEAERDVAELLDSMTAAGLVRSVAESES